MSHTGEVDENPPITNVFVLMLENHSFDHIFAMSGIDGIRVATSADCNSWTAPGPTTMSACVNGEAPWTMTTDPGHEFADVVEQVCGVKPCCPPGYTGPSDLCNDDKDCYSGGKYPAVDMSGFCANYATSRSEGTGTPTADHVGDIMACFETPKWLPVIDRLANEFAICDAWFSSMPGPTWPNRFFMHGASSAGVAQSPNTTDEIAWETFFGFTYENGSIFDALNDADHGWRIYQDKDNDFSDCPSPWYQGGWISQAASLKGLSLLDIHSFRKFAGDLNECKSDGSPAYTDVPYTFIEPNFGASFLAKQRDADGKPIDKGPTYRGGSSQHPEDDPSGWEGLIKAVYETIRASPVWESSLLFVVYDEHGGFFDHVPPGPAMPPGDKVPKGHEKLNEWNFDFAQYGVRVPAVVVSPLIPKNTVSQTVYDHSSILATVERLLGLDPLTERDRAANDVRHLLSLDTPRTDCPLQLPAPVRRPATDSRAALPGDDDAITGPSNMTGFLHVLLKTELELAGDDHAAHEKIVSRFREITTNTEAQRYLLEVSALIEGESTSTSFVQRVVAATRRAVGWLRKLIGR